MAKQQGTICQWQHFLILLTLALAVYVSSRSLPSESQEAIKVKYNCCKPTYVLVHGAGMGAWSWYKVVTELKQHGFDAVAIDLAAGGIHPADPNSVTNIEQLSQPLIDFVASFTGQKNLILVGHSLGGISISRAMELYPQKVLLAIYVAAVMPLDGDSFYDTLTVETRNEKNDKMALIFENPSSPVPTSGFLLPQNIQKILLNRCPPEDVELVKLLYRPVPFRHTLDRIHLTQENYGSIERHYIRLLDDFGFLLKDQHFNIERNIEALGSKVHTINSDHTVQLSEPKKLTDVIVAIFSAKLSKVTETSPST